MRQTAIRLADGRELYYFDDSAGPPERADRGRPDTRTLPPPPAASEVRYDPVYDEWVAVAAHRQHRTFLPPARECPLCPSTANRATEIPAYDYDVVAFENRFPSFSDRFAAPPGAAATDEDGGLVPVRPGQGRCEVVCFTSDHDTSVADLPPARIRTVLDALAARTTALHRLPGVAQVCIWENRGEEIGVTLSHPHGQIYAYPFLTPRTRQLLASARAHQDRTGRNLFADILAAELSAKVRVVVANDHWTAFVPAFARWPFEVHLYPHRQVPDIAALSGDERDAFAPLYREVLRRLDNVFGVPMPYVSAWHQAPVAEGRDVSHLYLQLFSIRRAPGRLKYLAGSESAMGAFINDIRPEDAAAMLRDADPDGPTVT